MPFIRRYQATDLNAVTNIVGITQYELTKDLLLTSPSSMKLQRLTCVQEATVYLTWPVTYGVVHT